MSKKPNVVASYGDPKKSKRWAAKRIRREFAKEILGGMAEWSMAAVLKTEVP